MKFPGYCFRMKPSILSNFQICISVPLKSTVTKKRNCASFKLKWRKLLKEAAFAIFPTSIIALFEIHQRFKGHFLNELRVSFKHRLYFRKWLFVNTWPSFFWENITLNINVSLNMKHQSDISILWIWQFTIT